ncbi:MAG: TetR/AcrR family transcriptional regulator [bacterium]|nr:TetR/AcrR family transcriptional regulator [bacterium]MDE0601790.1 TetR/AcrR family transcriptional regulator [bacterium]
MSSTASIETERNPRPGRPRDPEVDRAIVRATLKALADHGYRGMSIEGVAEEAGVGKTTIYRRYASKVEMVVAALSTLRDPGHSLPDTGRVRTDLSGMMALARTTLLRGFSLMGAVLVEEDRNPELLKLVRERIIGPRRDEAVTMLQRAVDRGEIRPDVDPEAAVHAIVGSLFMRRLLGVPESEEWIRQTVEVVCRGVLADPRGS